MKALGHLKASLKPQFLTTKKARPIDFIAGFLVGSSLLILFSVLQGNRREKKSKKQEEKQKSKDKGTRGSRISLSHDSVSAMLDLKCNEGSDSLNCHGENPQSEAKQPVHMDDQLKRDIIASEKPELQMMSTHKKKNGDADIGASDDDFKNYEILLHNISHKDMVVSLTERGIPAKDQGELVLGRPKFSLFHPIGKALREHAEEVKRKGAISPETIEFQAYSRSKGRSPQPLPAGNKHLPVGLNLASNPLPVQNLQDLRFRREQGKALEGKKVDITGVYFPLLSVLIPKWLKVVSSSSKCQKIVLLISGAGQPRNRMHSFQSNSTQEISNLMEMFLQKVYPELKVVKIHSNTNIFRYDENILFVRKELAPRIDKLRNHLALRYGEEWQSRLHLTISFADGSPARVSAISASLRSYRPSYMHIWELKTFWHETKVCEDDVEMLDFEDIDTIAPEPLSEAVGAVRLLVAEMARFKRDFDTVLQRSLFSPFPGSSHDLDSFWLRKTRKPVLAVLLVQKPNQSPKVYRGTNMEVSMPTGSLCAERNVIGTALADDLSLKREDLKLIAVLSLRLSRDKLKGTDSIGSSSPFSTPITSPTRNAFLLDRSSSSQASCKEELLHSSSNLSETQFAKRELFGKDDLDQDSPHFITSYESPELPALKSARSVGTGLDRLNDLTDESDFPRKKTATLRKLSIHNEVVKTEKQTVLKEEMNPLKPCGACNEWLKKIAEVNPDFKVVTFTDSQCTGMYIEPVY